MNHFKIYAASIFLLTLFLSPPAFAQPPQGVQKKEAVEMAEAWAESSHPPVNLRGMQAHIVFVDRENQWIIRFVKAVSPEITQCMIRVEAISGHHPQFVAESVWDRYENYFDNYKNSK